MALPMPRAAPVTRATRPARSGMFTSTADIGAGWQARWPQTMPHSRGSRQVAPRRGRRGETADPGVPAESGGEAHVGLAALGVHPRHRLGERALELHGAEAAVGVEAHGRGDLDGRCDEVVADVE